MARKEKTSFPLPDDIGHDFERQNDILTFRPRINFVQPEQQPLDEFVDHEIELPDTIDTLRQQTEDLVEGYAAVVKLAEQAQRRIDDRVANSGNFSAKLDPKVDAAVIAAIKRCHPEHEDSTTLTFGVYKDCLTRLRQNRPRVPQVTAEDIKAAKEDPLRTDFGGYGNQHGENRPEISSAAGAVSPLDLSAFQAAGVLALFLLLFPMIKKEDKLEVAQHLASAGHAV
ncbi:MAG: hypothetical protein DRI24_22955 [Deltaproteobacteria bacterium]|nr:MAG: hypothetical protein DRI24_22955 [Deltaproteobacteria bacterium]